ncbi:type II toxin-antitoxin system VapC family toxin [Treponema sp. R6D11]
MNVIIDVSGSTEILLRKEKSKKFDDLLQEAKIVLTPDLYISELSNTFWKYAKIKKYNKDDCTKYIQDGLDYIEIFIDSRTIWEEAFTESINNNHSVYDMFYMVAARRNNATLITNDKALAAICKKNHVQVCC